MARTLFPAKQATPKKRALTASLVLRIQLLHTRKEFLLQHVVLPNFLRVCDRRCTNIHKQRKETDVCSVRVWTIPRRVASEDPVFSCKRDRRAAAICVHASR